MKKIFFVTLVLLLIVSCAQSKLDCRGKDPRCTDETGFDLIDIDFFWLLGSVSCGTRFVVSRFWRTGLESLRLYGEIWFIIIFPFTSDNICYVYF